MITWEPASKWNEVEKRQTFGPIVSVGTIDCNKDSEANLIDRLFYTLKVREKPGK